MDFMITPWSMLSAGGASTAQVLTAIQPDGQTHEDQRVGGRRADGGGGSEEVRGQLYASAADGVQQEAGAEVQVGEQPARPAGPMEDARQQEIKKLAVCKPEDGAEKRGAEADREGERKGEIGQVYQCHVERRGQGSR